MWPTLLPMVAALRGVAFGTRSALAAPRMASVLPPATVLPPADYTTVAPATVLPPADYTGVVTPTARSTAQEASTAELEACVYAHDYSCIANGRPFVAPNWLSDDLLTALRADARALRDAGSFVDANEKLGKRVKLSLTERDWCAPGEEAPSEARAVARRLFDTLLVELERVLGRRLSLEEHGAQAKYAIACEGEPLAFHVDQRHEALQSHEEHHGDATRRTLAALERDASS